MGGKEREEKARELTEVIITSAQAIAKDVKAKAIFLYLDAVPNQAILQKLSSDPDLFLITHSSDIPEKLHRLAKRVLVAPPVSLTRLGQIKLGVLMAMSANLLRTGDRIVCLSGLAELQNLDSIYVLEIGKESELVNVLESEALTESTSPEVFQAVLTLALELANQGREGKPIGAIFVIGDHDRVYGYSRQMIINPFKGYPPAERNIIDPKLKETIKEFASLDGAFVITGDGTVMCAGRHLNAAYNGDGLPQGLGARHAAAAAITGVTKAVAITISESTGTVTIFKDGKILMELEKP